MSYTLPLKDPINEFIMYEASLTELFVLQFVLIPLQKVLWLQVLMHKQLLALPTNLDLWRDPGDDSYENERYLLRNVM